MSFNVPTDTFKRNIQMKSYYQGKLVSQEDLEKNPQISFALPSRDAVNAYRMKIYNNVNPMIKYDISVSEHGITHTENPLG